jgi:hypothetical protein
MRICGTYIINIFSVLQYRYCVKKRKKTEQQRRAEQQRAAPLLCKKIRKKKHRAELTEQANQAYQGGRGLFAPPLVAVCPHSVRKATGGKESLGEGMGGRVNFLGACGGSVT